MLGQRQADRGGLEQLRRVDAIVAGISRPSMPRSRRCSLSRSRLQTSCGGLATAAASAPRPHRCCRSASRQSSEVGCDHDRDVMIGQRRRQVRLPGIDIKHQQFDAGLFEQEFDRRVAAHVDRRRQRQHPQPRLLPRRANGTADATPASRAGSQDRSACRRAIARSATDRAPRRHPAVPSSNFRSACPTSGEDPCRQMPTWQARAMPMRSAQSGSVTPIRW